MNRMPSRGKAISLSRHCARGSLYSQTGSTTAVTAEQSHQEPVIPSVFESSFLFSPSFLATQASPHSMSQSVASFHLNKMNAATSAKKPSDSAVRLPPIIPRVQTTTASSLCQSSRKSQSISSTPHAQMLGGMTSSTPFLHGQLSIQSTSTSSTSSFLSNTQRGLFYETNKILRVKDYKILKNDTSRILISTDDAVASAQRRNRLQNFEMKVQEYLRQIAIKKDLLKAKQSNRCYKNIEASLDGLACTMPSSTSTVATASTPRRIPHSDCYPDTFDPIAADDDDVKNLSKASRNNHLIDFTRTFYSLNEMQFEALSQEAVGLLSEQDRADYYEVLRQLDTIAQRFQVIGSMKPSTASTFNGQDISPSTPQRTIKSRLQPKQYQQGYETDRYYDKKISAMRALHETILLNLSNKSFWIDIPKHLIVRQEHFNDYYKRLYDPTAERRPVKEEKAEEEEELIIDDEQSVDKSIDSSMKSLSDMNFEQADCVDEIRMPTVEDEPETQFQQRTPVQSKQKKKSSTVIVRPSVLGLPEIQLPIQTIDSNDGSEISSPISSRRGRGSPNSSVNRSRNSSRANFRADRIAEDGLGETDEEEISPRRNYGNSFFGGRTPRSPTPLPADSSTIVRPTLNSLVIPQSPRPLERSDTPKRIVLDYMKEEEQEGFEQAVGEYVEVQEVVRIVEQSPKMQINKVVKDIFPEISIANILDQQPSSSSAMPSPQKPITQKDSSKSFKQAQSIKRENTRLNVNEARGEAMIGEIAGDAFAEESTMILGTGLIDYLLKCKCIGDIDVTMFSKKRKRVEIDTKVKHQTEFDRSLFSRLAQWQFEITEDSSDFTCTIFNTQTSMLDAFNSDKREQFSQERQKYVRAGSNRDQDDHSKNDNGEYNDDQITGDVGAENEMGHDSNSSGDDDDDDNDDGRKEKSLDEQQTTNHLESQHSI